MKFQALSTYDDGPPTFISLGSDMTRAHLLSLLQSNLNSSSIRPVGVYGQGFNIGKLLRTGFKLFKKGASIGKAVYQ